MITWKNMDTLAAYEALQATQPIDLAAAMSGEAGAERVKNYTVPMGEGLAFNYGARPVDDKILEALGKLAEEAQLAEKYEARYQKFKKIYPALKELFPVLQ
jgi:glucose-6-phosphate isomerase